MTETPSTNSETSDERLVELIAQHKAGRQAVDMDESLFKPSQEKSYE